MEWTSEKRILPILLACKISGIMRYKRTDQVKISRHIKKPGMLLKFQQKEKKKKKAFNSHAVHSPPL